MAIDSMTNFIGHFKNLIIGSFLDGWDNALEILLIIMTLDYVTGLASAFKKKAVSSSVGYTGLIKKASIFIIVILAAQMDRMVGDGSHLFRNGTSFFFSANDAISVLENIGQIGIKMPSFLKKTIVNLKDTYDSAPVQSEKKENKK